MNFEENLTNIQKVAIRGEVAYALSSSAHDAEIKYRIYWILKQANENEKAYYVQCFKDSTTFDDSIIDRLFLETCSDNPPIDLWIDKIIEDIKAPLFINDPTATYAKISIDKTLEKKRLIESAFINFTRRAFSASPKGTEQLLDAILADDDLDFLHVSCFYLKNSCPEVRKFVADDDCGKLMGVYFDPRECLSFEAELDIMDKLIKAEDRASQNLSEEELDTQEEIEAKPIIKVTFEGDISQKELSEFISQKVVELFSDVRKQKTVSKKENDDSIRYVVQKVFNDSHYEQDIRECKTEEEAIEFIEQIKKDYPEYLKTQSFKVCRKRLN